MQRHWKSELGDRIPPKWAIPLRARWGRSREAEVDLLSQFLRPGDVAIDIGGHLGIWTQSMAQIVGRTGLVIALEPQVELADYLRKGFSGRTQVRIISAAASNTDSVMSLHIPLDNGSRATGGASLEQEFFSQSSVDIDAIQLDSLGLHAVRVMKIDVEGHELSVLEGARDLIAKCRPVIFAELDWSMASDKVADFAHKLSSFGYASFRYSNRQLIALDIEDFNSPTVNLGGVNFIFLPQ